MWKMVMLMTPSNIPDRAAAHLYVGRWVPQTHQKIATQSPPSDHPYTPYMGPRRPCDPPENASIPGPRISPHTHS